MNYNRLFLLLKFANKEGALNALRPHLNFSEEENNSIITALQNFSDKEVPKIVGAIIKELKNDPSITSLAILTLIDSRRKVVVNPTILPLETPVKKESPLGSLLSENIDKDSILQYVSSLSSDLTRLVEGLVIRDTSINMSNLTEIIESVKSLPNKYQKWVVNRFGSNANKEELHPIADCLPIVKDYAGSEQGILKKFSENEDFNKKIQDLLGTTSISNSDLLSSDDMVNILNFYRTADLTLTATKIKQLTTLPLEDKVGEAGEWEVWLPSTRENSCAIARVDNKLDPKTTWCTARTKSSNLFYNYVGLSDGNMILFYIIKKNPVAKPENSIEDNDWISVGYFNGKRTYNGDGTASVNRSNEGIRDDQHLMEILGDNYSAITAMMDQKNKELGGVSPALVKVQEAARDVNLYLEMVKGNSESEKLDLDNAILKIPPSEEVSNKIIETSNERSLLSIARNKAATEYILNKILEISNDRDVLFSIAINPSATEYILNKILQKTNDEDILYGISQNKSLTENIINKLLELSNKDYVLKNIACSKAATEDILNKILEKTNSITVLRYITESKAATEDILNKILEKTNDEIILRNVAISQAATKDILNKILEISNYRDVLFSIAGNPNATEDILNKILEKTNDENILANITINPFATEYILNKILEKTNDENILANIAKSTAATEDILNKILEKSDHQSVLRSIAQSEAVSEDILNKLIEKTDIVNILFAISQSKAATEDIINKLLKKTNSIYFLIELAKSRAANENILNKILELSDNNSDVLYAITKNKFVTENILNKILTMTNSYEVLFFVNEKLSKIRNQEKTASLLAKVNFFYKLAINLN